MGKKGNWFVAVKKAFSPDSKEKKEKKSRKSKKWGPASEKEEIPSSSIENVLITPPPDEEIKLAEAENEQSKHAYSVALATAAAAEAAVAAAHAAAEVVRLTSVARYTGKSVEEVAAIRIQTAFRGYLARRALRALRGLVRLKTLIDGQSVKRQATTTLRCMQTLARVQSQIRARRVRMSEENQALQRQLQLKCERELANLSMSEDWDDSIQSKEQVEANLLSKHDATIRRERALAYAYSHQQGLKNSSRPVNPMFMDPNNPHWGWSWLERWMAARPWESRNTTERELNDQSSVKSSVRSVTGEINKAYLLRDLKATADKPSPTGKKPTRQSPSTPSKAASSSSAAGKLKSASPRGGAWAPDDTKSTFSMQSERYRRHSIAGSSVRDDESMASSPSVPSYMAPTKSAKAKAKLQSPLGFEKTETPDRPPTGSAKKRLSFPAPAAPPRRHSGPPKIDCSPFKEIGLQAEVITNGGS